MLRRTSLLFSLLALIALGGIEAQTAGQFFPGETLGQTWKQALDAREAEKGQVEPFVYYVDAFGAYYYDQDLNVIYNAAARPWDNLPTGIDLVEEEDDCAWLRSEAGGLDFLEDCDDPDPDPPPPPPPGPSCWQFTYDHGTPFPNPLDNSYPSAQKARINLLVLGTDSVLYSATIKVEIFNILSQLIYSRTIGTFPSSPSFDVVLWDGYTLGGTRVASGSYFVRTTATSSLCGSKSITKQVLVVH